MKWLNICEHFYVKYLKTTIRKEKKMFVNINVDSFRGKEKEWIKMFLILSNNLVIFLMKT